MPPVAAIDAGSNAIRLAIVDVGPTGILVRRVTRRYALRLGADVFASGAIGAARAAEVVRVFSDIADRMRRLAVARYRAVATSAMREAADGLEVAEAVRARAGLDVEIISGAEEGRIMRLTLMRALGSLSADCLLVDLGGGSVELEHTTDVGGCSLPLGTLRLLQRHPEMRAPLGRRRLAELGDAVRGELRACLGAQPSQADLAIGTGGNLDALARLVPLRSASVPAIDLGRLRAFAGRLARLSAAERARRFGLRPDRADVILPAALVILALAEVFALRYFAVPGTGIRESILHTLITESTRPSRARELLQARSHDLTLPDRRARIARRLFELLAALHGLWPPAVAPLESAAYLLEGSGLYDRERSAHEAIELLRLSPELDLEPRCRAVAAHVVQLTLDRDLRAGRIATGDRKVAETLAAILRLSLALTAASDAWEPLVDLMQNPFRINVGLRGWLTRSDLTPLERVLGRRIKVV